LIPFRFKMENARPACSGFGSFAATTTSLIPLSMIAFVQGGVRPSVLHGSSVT
jgi:hypothetical protein